MHSPSSPGHGIEPLETLREETPSPGTPLPVLSPVVEDEQDGPEEGGTYFAPIHFGPRPAREQGSNGAQTSTESTRLFTGFGGGNSHYSYEGQQLHPAASNRSPGTGNQLTQAFSNTSAATTEKLGRRDSLTTAHNTISADRSDVETGEPPLDVRARRASAASTVSRTRSHNMTPVQSPTVRRDGRRPSLTTSHNTFGTDRSDTETGEPSLEERKRRSSETLRRQKSYEGVRQSVSHQSHPPPVAWNSRGSRTLTPQSSQQSYATAQGDVEKANRPSTESRPSSTLSHTRSHNGFGVDERQEDEVFVEAENNGKDEVIVVTWDNGDEDPMNPRSWPRWRKWAIVIILSIAAFCVFVTPCTLTHSCSLTMATVLLHLQSIRYATAKSPPNSTSHASWLRLDYLFSCSAWQQALSFSPLFPSSMVAEKYTLYPTSYTSYGWSPRQWHAIFRQFLCHGTSTAS